MEGIRAEWEKSKQELESRAEEREEMAERLALREKEYKGRVEELEEEKVRLERALMMARS